jgi:hypothetical protein
MSRSVLRSSAVFSAALCPMAAVVGWIVFMSSKMYDRPGDITQAILYASGYIGIATLTYLIAVIRLERKHVKTVESCSWRLPVLCAVLLSGFTCVGLVENSTDVAAQVLGHRYDGAMIVISMIVWSGVATYLGFRVGRARWSQPIKPFQADRATPGR